MKTVDLSILLLVYHRVLSIFEYVLSLKAEGRVQHSHGYEYM